ncbi:hypothetical protein ACFSUI_21330 [Ralstonia solanacearum]
MDLIRIIKGLLRCVLKLNFLLVWLDDSQFDRPTTECPTRSVRTSAPDINFVPDHDNIGSTTNIGDNFERSPLIEGNIDSHIIPGYHIGRIDHLEQPFGITFLVPSNLRSNAQLLIHVEQIVLARQIEARPWVVLDVAMVIEAIHDLLGQPCHVVQRLLADCVAEADRCGSPVGGREAAAGQRQQRGHGGSQQRAAHNEALMP